MNTLFFPRFLNHIWIGRDRVFQRDMTGNTLCRFSVDKNLDSFDLREVEGKRIDNGVDRHQLRRTSTGMLLGEGLVKIDLGDSTWIHVERQ